MRHFEKRLYLFILLFAPLAFGTTELWSRAILALAIFVCAVVFFYARWKANRSLLKVPGLWPLIVWLGVITLQMVPLPAFLVDIISPATHTLYQETLGLTGPVKWMRLTVDLKATLLQWISFSGYVLFYVLSVQLLNNATFLKRVVKVVIAFGAVMALLAIIQHFSAPGKIFWFRETIHGHAFGPYVNRNHYAGLMVMLFPIAFSMMLYNKPRVSYDTWRERLSEFFNCRTTNVYLLLLLAVMLMGTSVFVSLSRGGIVCLSLGLVLLGVLMAFKANTNRGRGVMVAAVFGVLLLSVGWFGWDPIFERFSQIRDPAGDISESRLGAWQDSIDIIKTYPATGTGAGTFFHAHKAFRNVTPGSKFFVHAHNDYIEIASTHGIIGLICLGTFVFAVLASFRRYRKRHEPYCIYLFLGAVTGMVAVLIHCIVEFNLQIGANALYFFFLAGLCVSAAHTRLRAPHPKSFLHRYRQSWIAPALAASAALLMIFGTMFNLGAYLGQLHFNNVRADYEKDALTDRDYASIQSRALKVSYYDPLESQNYVILSDAQAALSETDAALASCNRAIGLNPMNGIYLQTQASLYTQNGQYALAEQFHRSALEYEGANPRIHANFGLWLITRGDFEKGAAVIQQAIALSPSLTKDMVNALARREMTYADITTALPPMVRPFIELGEFLVSVEQVDLALAAYAQAVDYLPTTTDVQAPWIRQIHRFYMDQDRFDEAFRVVSAGVDYLPDDSGLRYTLGTLYENMGITYRAVEEYEMAIVLNPNNMSARRRLEKLQDHS